MAAAAPPNPYLSTQASSGLQVILHPLVLLTISDYITRHTLRNQAGPVAGALLGKIDGHEVKVNHAFDIYLQPSGENGSWVVNEEKFELRQKLMMEVHPDLELVGWYTLLSSKGPSAAIMPIHSAFFDKWTSEAAIFLGFHTEEVINHTVGGKLPLTVYESIYEVDDPTANRDGEDRKMDDGQPGLSLKFRELPYSIETDETEMISMDFIAGAGGSAAAAAPKDEKLRSIESNGKGKRRLVESGDDKRELLQTDDAGLTQAEDELIAALTTRANAIKMLRSRISLLTTYLERLPPSYVSGETADPGTMDTDNTTPSLTVLRQIQALVSRFDLVIPSDRAAFETEQLCEANDVQLVELLNDVVQSAAIARDVGKKANTVELGKMTARRPNVAALVDHYSVEAMRTRSSEGGPTNSFNSSGPSNMFI